MLPNKTAFSVGESDIEFRFGTDGVLSSYKYEVNMVYTSSGGVSLKPKGEEECFNSDYSCLRELSGVNREACLLCDVTDGIEWKVNPKNKSSSCKLDSSDLTGYKMRSNSYFFQKMKTYGCDIGLRGADCSVACTSSCSACILDGNTNCIECPWEFSQALSVGTSVGVCAAAVCSANEYFSKSTGVCLRCPDQCPGCVAGECTAACTGGRTKKYGICCFINQGEYVSFENGFPECKSCHSTCSRCEGPEINQCFGCQAGLILNSATGKCGLGCQNNRYFDSGTNKCEKCPENCLTCDNQDTCTSCGFFSSLVTSGGRTSCQKNIKCYEICRTCDGEEEKDCNSCKLDVCLSLDKGTCVRECPLEDFTPNDPNDILENAKLIFNVKEVYVDYLEENEYDKVYKLVFSEQDILLIPPLNFDNLNQYLEVIKFLIFLG